MNKQTIIYALAGVAIGYLAASTLSGYQPFTKAYEIGSGL